jgi:O-antigen/teichoic acid export membrane protein
MSTTLAPPRIVPSSPSRLGRRLAHGAFWCLAGAFVARGANFLAGVLAARLLGREDFGRLGIVQSTIGLFGTVAGLGMGLMATKYVAEHRARDPERVARIIGLSTLVSWSSGIAMTLALVVAAPWMAGQTLRDPGLTATLRLGSWLLLLGAINGAQAGALAGFEAFRATFRTNLAAGILGLAAVVAGTCNGGLNGAVAGLVAGLAIAAVLNHWTLRRECRAAGVVPTFAGCTQEWPILWRFGLPNLLNILMAAAAFWASQGIIARQHDGFGALGTFNAAYQGRTMVIIVALVLSQLYLAVISGAGRDDPAAFRALIWSKVRLNVGSFTLSAAAIAALAPWIIKIYGATFAGARDPLILLGLSLVGFGFTEAIFLGAQGREKLWWMLVMNIIWAFLLVGATWALRSHGATGLAAANLIAYTAQAFLVALVARRLIDR